MLYHLYDLYGENSSSAKGTDQKIRSCPTSRHNLRLSPGSLVLQLSERHPGQSSKRLDMDPSVPTCTPPRRMVGHQIPSAQGS